MRGEGLILPNPDFYILDQALEPGSSYVIGREDPMRGTGAQSLGLYTYQTIREFAESQREGLSRSKLLDD